MAKTRRYGAMMHCREYLVIAYAEDRVGTAFDIYTASSRGRIDADETMRALMRN
jgi:hypothetical protein